MKGVAPRRLQRIELAAVFREPVDAEGIAAGAVCGRSADRCKRDRGCHRISSLIPLDMAGKAVARKQLQTHAQVVAVRVVDQPEKEVKIKMIKRKEEYQKSRFV